jgi:hypothetical protein
LGQGSERDLATWVLGQKHLVISPDEKKKNDEKESANPQILFFPPLPNQREYEQEEANRRQRKKKRREGVSQELSAVAVNSDVFRHSGSVISGTYTPRCCNQTDELQSSCRLQYKPCSPDSSSF